MRNVVTDCKLRLQYSLKPDNLYWRYGIHFAGVSKLTSFQICWQAEQGFQNWYDNHRLCIVRVGLRRQHLAQQIGLACASNSTNIATGNWLCHNYLWQTSRHADIKKKDELLISQGTTLKQTLQESFLAKEGHDPTLILCSSFAWCTFGGCSARLGCFGRLASSLLSCNSNAVACITTGYHFYSGSFWSTGTRPASRVKSCMLPW